MSCPYTLIWQEAFERKAVRHRGCHVNDDVAGSVDDTRTQIQVFGMKCLVLLSF